MSGRYLSPVTQYSFRRPPWAAMVLAGIWLLVAAILLIWSCQPQASAWQLLVAVLLLMCAALLLFRQWRNWPEGDAIWNGEHWVLSEVRAGPSPSKALERVGLHVGLDGGSWLWIKATVQLQPGQKQPFFSQVLWLFFEERSSPVQWGDLRRAVYSSAIPLAEQA